MWNTLLSDNFNRATLGTDFTQTIPNTWTISNNKLATVAPTASLLYKTISFVEHKIAVTIDNLVPLTVLVTRYNTSTTNGYYCVLNKTTNLNITIGRYSNNNSTLNTIVTDTLVTSETTLKVEFWAISNYPTNLYAFIYNNSGTLLKVVTGIDNTNELQTQTTVGINYASSDTLASFDNLVISNLINNSIKPGDSKLVLSPYNWNIENTIATTINAGSYIKCKFTGTYLELRTDINSYLSNSNTNYPSISYTIDNEVSSEVTINNSRIVISGLEDKEHTFIGFVNKLDVTVDRWNTPLSKFVLKELVVDDNKEFKTITKYNTNTLILGDSISEGRAIDNVNDFSVSYLYYLMQQLNSEVGNVSYASSGFSTVGVGNVPKAVTNVDYYYANKLRSFSVKPNVVIINLGTNDFLGNVATNVLKTDITTLITKLLSYGDKNTKIIVLIPFGGYKRDVITETVTAINNKQLILVDLVEDKGLNNTGASYKSADGIHPNLKYSAVLGAKLGNKLVNLNNKNKLLDILKNEGVNLRFDNTIETRYINKYLNTI